MNSQGDLGILKVLTENPELMQKAMSIASSLASSGALSGLGLLGNDQSNQPKQNASSQAPNVGDLSAIFGALGANTSQNAQKPIPIQETKNDQEKENGHEHKTSHRDRIKLLEAMRPFVPVEKREKLEFVIRLLGLIQVADQLGIKNMIEGR